MKTSDEMKEIISMAIQIADPEKRDLVIRIHKELLPKVEMLENSLKFLYDHITSTFDCNDCVHVVFIDDSEDTGCDIDLCIDPKDCEEFIFCEDSDNHLRKAKELL